MRAADDVQILLFSVPLDFPLLPASYLLLEVNRSYGCVEKEKELRQTAVFCAEHSFSSSFGHTVAGNRDDSGVWFLQGPGKEELRTLQ